MTTAATLLTETLIPTAKTAATGIGASGLGATGLGATGLGAFGLGASGQGSFTTSFASLLAQGNFVQAPGMVPVEGEGAPDLASLLSVGEVGAAVAGEEGSADPLFNVIPLFDSTSLSTPSPATRIPGLGLGVTTSLTDGASINGLSVAADGHEPAAPVLPPAADSAHSAHIAQAATVQTDPGNPKSVPAQAAAQTDKPHATSRPAHSGVTAADVMAEIIHLNPRGLVVPEGLEPIGEGVETALNSPDGNRDSTPAAAAATVPQTGLTPAPSPVAAAATLAAPASVTLPVPRTIAAASATSRINTGQAAEEGAPPDPRLSGQVAQSVTPRPTSQVRATASKAAAKPTTGLSSALSGDVAMAAMAVDTPKPGAGKPAASRVPVAGHGASAPPANPNSGETAMPSSPQTPASGRLQPATGQGNSSPAPAGQALEHSSLGSDTRLPMAEISDQQATPRPALDVRIDLPQSAPQPQRAGETAAQPERPMGLPTPLSGPPAEQVAMQLRHGVAKGADKIIIQLNPASLGAVEVTLEISSGSRAVVHIVADRADTLDLLRADARGLERALQEAGLRTEQGSINFNLRGEGEGASHQNSASLKDFDGAGQDDGSDGDGDGPMDADETEQDEPTRQASNQALDIEV